MQISRVQISELDVLRAFAERTFRIAFQASNDLGRFEAYCEKAFSLERFRAELEHANSQFWFYYKDDTLAAYLKLNFDRHAPDLGSNHTVQVERLYVEPAFQGQRIGEKLLDFAKLQAKNAAADWLWLSVWQENPPALRFYERCGFEIFGTQTFWMGDEAQTDWLVKMRVTS
jgi:ribosomal protein S18 acetylase RimI-like enzyme